MRKTKALSGAPSRARVLMAAAVLASCAAATVFAQGEAPKGAPATVAGRVTDGKRGLAGVVVVLVPGNVPWSADPASAKTDAEGRYRVGGLAPGRYQVVPVAPAHVLSGADAEDVPGGQRGKTLNLAPGETVENTDFRLTRGGVITGRATGADGRPLVGEFVLVTAENGSRPAHGAARPDRTEQLTDDRGVYRVYGLPAGRYRVSVGSDTPPRGPRGASADGVKTYNRRTYYPDTTDAAEARLVEVSEGSETTDIDIRVEKVSRQTYTASGRIVFAETGQPAPNVRLGYSMAARGGARGINLGGTFPGGREGLVSDARGEFKLEGLLPGRYVAYAVREGGADWYSEQASFEVAEADTEGVEVKLRRGASISGVLQFEGVTDRAAAARLLGRARLYAAPESAGGGPPVQGGFVSATVGADGGFSLTGLQPGRVRIAVGGDRESGVVLLRVEQNGADATRGVEVAEGAQVTGVRVVAAHGSAVVRGQINVTGGTLPQGWSLRAFARRVGEQEQPGLTRTVVADSRGHFVMENMVAGDYEIRAGAYFLAARGDGPPPTPPTPRQPDGLSGPRQRLTIAPGGEHNVTLVLPVNEGANQ